MPAVIQPILWSDVPEITSTNESEFLTVLQKQPSDNVEWRRIKQQNNLIYPRVGTFSLTSETPGITLGTNICAWWAINKIFVYVAGSFTVPTGGSLPTWFYVKGFPFGGRYPKQVINSITSSSGIKSEMIVGLVTALSVCNLYPPTGIPQTSILVDFNGLYCTHDLIV